MTDTSEPTIDWATAPAHFRAAFEAQAQRLAEQETRVANLDRTERENAMLRAGVDLEHPAAAIFVAGYTGKLDVDDVKAAWAPFAGSTPPPAAETPPVNPDGSDPAVVAQLADLQNQRDRLGSGGTPVGEEPTADPQTEMIQDFHERRARGRNRDQAMAMGLDGLFARAAEGDPRVASSGAPGITAAQQSVRNWREKQEFE